MELRQLISPCRALLCSWQLGMQRGRASQVASKVSPGPSQPQCHLDTEMWQRTLPKPWEVTWEKLLGQLEMHKGCPESLWFHPGMGLLAEGHLVPAPAFKF